MARVTGLKCVSCGEEYPESMMFEGCPRCRDGEFASNLDVEYDYEDLRGLTRDALSSWKGEGIWRFSALLPVAKQEHRVSLGEGNTPLLECPSISKLCDARILVKDEARNPTWSYKDRLACVATGMALQWGARVTTMASTGNHGAATAAYAARAGLDCVIFTLPTVPTAMLSLMQSYGAKVLSTTFYGRWRLVSYGVKTFGWYPMGNYVDALPTGNPYGGEGYKTIAYEICLQSGWRVPDMVVCPVGYGDGFHGIWKGFREMFDLGLIGKLPRMVAAEPEGGPISNAIDKRLRYPVRVVAKPTVAFSIRCDLTGVQSVLTVRESGGTAVGVSDPEIMAAQTLLGREGVYAEPSSAAAVAAAVRLAKSGDIGNGDTVVCILTSSGLKDPGATASVQPRPPEIEPNVDAMLRALKETFDFDPSAADSRWK